MLSSTREIAKGVHWTGGSDRRLALFENMFPLPSGVAYNSYLILDEKTAVIDTVDSGIDRLFYDNIGALLGDRPLDYLVLNHMEPDHCACVDELCRRYPGLTVVGNKKTFQLISQFYGTELSGRTLEVKDGDELSLGRHSLSFLTAPMVHWPEVMFTYEKTEKILFSADAFGAFGAHNGGIFADEYDFDSLLLDEARRYYSNIVGKYGPQVRAALKKAGEKEIKYICPLHGPVWRRDIDYILGKYTLWSGYEPEKKGVVAAYASMYGNTARAAEAAANELAKLGVSDMRVYDISKTHYSHIIGDMFKYSHFLLAAPTYNAGLYPGMEALLRDMGMLGLRDRKFALIANGSWAPAAHRVMEELLSGMKGMEQVFPTLMLTSAPRPEQGEELAALAAAVVKSM